MIGKYIYKRKYGATRQIDDVYKLNFDELLRNNINSTYGIHDITDKGIVLRLGNRLVLMSEDEAFQSFVLLRVLLTEGVRLKGE